MNVVSTGSDCKQYQAHTSIVAPKHNEANAMQENTTRLKAVRLDDKPKFCCARSHALSSTGASARAAAILATCKYTCHMTVFVLRFDYLVNGSCVPQIMRQIEQPNMHCAVLPSVHCYMLQSQA